MAFCVLTSILLVFKATNKLVKPYKTLQIILNDNGVETKAEMMPYKSIN
nr:hypothetical protein [Mucilaginibacter sp. SP1R1]